MRHPLPPRAAPCSGAEPCAGGKLRLRTRARWFEPLHDHADRPELFQRNHVQQNRLDARDVGQGSDLLADPLIELAGHAIGGPAAHDHYVHAMRLVHIQERSLEPVSDADRATTAATATAMPITVSAERMRRRVMFL